MRSLTGQPYPRDGSSRLLALRWINNCDSARSASWRLALMLPFRATAAQASLLCARLKMLGVREGPDGGHVEVPLHRLPALARG